MMNDTLNKTLSSIQKVSLYKYEPEKNPGRSFTRLVPKELFQIDDEKKIIKIKSLFEVQDTSNGSLRTSGEYYFEFESRDGQKTKVEYLPGGRLRSNELWKNDAILKRPMELLNWLASLGIGGPLEQEIQTQKRRQKEREKYKIISSKMPPRLITTEGRLDSSCLKKDSKALYQELIKDNSDENSLLLDLFELFVLRSNNWWEESTLEMLIKRVLLGAPTESINRLIEANNITLLQADGIARFLTCSQFQKKLNEEGINIPESVKEKVFALVEELGNGKKINLYQSKVLLNNE